MFCNMVMMYCLFFCEEFVAHHGEAGNKSDILLEVHCSISVGVQVLKDLIDLGLVFGLLLHGKT